MLLRGLRVPARAAAAGAAALPRRGYAAASAAPRNLLFKVTGSDQLGVVASFSRVLADHGAQILDVDQSACTVHSTFTLELLARVPPEGAVMSEMLATAQSMEVSMQVVALDPEKMKSDGERDGTRYKLTLYQRGMGFEALALVSEHAAAAGLSIERLDRLTPLEVPLPTRPPTALRIILGSWAPPRSSSTRPNSLLRFLFAVSLSRAFLFAVSFTSSSLVAEEGGTPGTAVAAACVDTFIKSLRFIQVAICIQVDGLCSQNDGFFIINDEFCIKNDEICI